MNCLGLVTANTGNAANTDIGGAVGDAGTTGERRAAVPPHRRATAARSRWETLQRSFIDDPQHAVQRGDELLADAAQKLSERLAAERRKCEAELNQTDSASTEILRVALRRYRSLSERLQGC